MTLQEIIEEIKFEVAGANALELEITDQDIGAAVQKALRELIRYWDETTLVTIPFSSCIDLTSSELDLKEKVSSVVRIYRTSSYGSAEGTAGMNDPLYMQQWQMFSNGGTMYNLNDYILNYASWNTLLQIKNTMATDLAFKEDRHNNKLYISAANDRPAQITVEYVPKLTDVEQIQSDYWIDILIRLSTDLTKVVLGRIRTRYTQSNALWTQDGERMLEEGNTDLKELREVLRVNSDYVYPID